MRFIAELLLRALVLLVTAYIIPGFKIDSYVTAIVVAFVLGILNMLIKPILILLTLPINILTLGLFTFVINAALLMITSSLIKGFSINSFATALLAAVTISIITTLASQLTG